MPTPVLDAMDIRPAEPPLITIQVPEGWEEVHVKIPISSTFVAGDVLLSVFEGPLPGNTTGYIWVVWRFPNFLSPTATDLDLWADAIWYLRSLLFEGCNIGPAGRRTYTIGGQEATGGIFAAVDSPEHDCAWDVAGWFAGLRHEGENYIFYMGVEPADMITEVRPHLQEVVDSITFIPVEEYSQTPEQN